MSGISTTDREELPRDRSRVWKLRIRRPLKGMGQWAIGTLGCGLSRLLGSRGGGAVGILAYHRVASKPARGPAPTWNVTPTRFREQLEGLLRRGYQAWPLRQVLDYRRGRRAIPPKTFVVTFDDGYENIYYHAWPVLRELGVAATVFVATAYLDSVAPFPFDDWPAAGSLDIPADTWRPLTSAHCAEMLAQGLIDVGSHTHTHAVFASRPDVLFEDVVTSVALLRARFGLTDATFSFPFGIAGPALTAAAQRAGVLCGLTTQPELVGPHDDPFTWGRFGVKDSDTAATLVAKLDGWYSIAHRVWLRMGGPVMASEQVLAHLLIRPAGESS